MTETKLLEVKVSKNKPINVLTVRVLFKRDNEVWCESTASNGLVENRIIQLMDERGYRAEDYIKKFPKNEFTESYKEQITKIWNDNKKYMEERYRDDIIFAKNIQN